MQGVGGREKCQKLQKNAENATSNSSFPAVKCGKLGFVDNFSLLSLLPPLSSPSPPPLPLPLPLPPLQSRLLRVMRVPFFPLSPLRHFTMLGSARESHNFPFRSHPSPTPQLSPHPKKKRCYLRLQWILEDGNKKSTAAAALQL